MIGIATKEIHLESVLMQRPIQIGKPEILIVNNLSKQCHS